MPQSYAALYVHVVFSTKNRVSVLEPDLRKRLFEFCGGLLRSRGSILMTAGGILDHVHLLVSLSRELAVAEVVRELKARSSKCVHESVPNLSDFAWQNGYGAFSVSQSGLDAVRDYITRQEEHHRERTFQEEFVILLQRHNFSFDERYLWD
jgi:REP element-mobilizing transposase RayT